MQKRLFLCALAVGLCCATYTVRGQESPLPVSGCELVTNPERFDGKTIRVRGRLRASFEDFTLDITKCDSDEGVWLAFGGDVPGIVVSTANDNFRKPGTDVQVNGVSYKIKKDEHFRRLYALLAAHQDGKPTFKVTATLTGTFFAGEKFTNAAGIAHHIGYGHLGCCSLLVITEVTEVESSPPANLHIQGVVTGPDGKPAAAVTVINDVLGGSPTEQQTSVTDKQGIFAFSNSGQQIRVESPEYRPLAVAVEPGGASVHLKLAPARLSDWILPVCESANSPSRVGFSVLFQIPPTMETERFDYPDMGREGFWVYPKGGSAVSASLLIVHDDQESKSVSEAPDFKWLEERWVKDAAGEVIGMEARGQKKDGSHARWIKVLGHDAASYDLELTEDREVHDRMIDSACLVKAAAN